jgi:hypothetical protein
VAIGPTTVKVSWDGQEKEFSPISAGGPGGPPGPRAGGERPGPPSGSAPMVVTGGRQGAGRGGPEMSPEDRERMRERFMNMTPEERQRLREERRQRLGGRS